MEMKSYLIKNLIVWAPGTSEEDALDRLREHLSRNGYTWNHDPLPDDPPIEIEEWDENE